MNEYFLEFTQNTAIQSAILGWVTAQVLKLVITLIFKRKFDLGRLLGGGGMPSSHTALVCALAANIGKNSGLDSALFAVALVLAFIVMYDAFNVRRAAGDQAKVLNYMISHWSETTPEIFGRELKELLGHTPFQVLCGAILGIAIGIFI